MKRVVATLIVVTVLIAEAATAQTPEKTIQENPFSESLARQYFLEAEALCQRDHGELWGVSLCGPIMFVDPQSRYIVANQADAKGVLKAAGLVFTGYLPKDQNVANTAVEWSGVHWTQILWPLPADPGKRGTLMAHELFHRIQDQLKLSAMAVENAHLDTVDGRYYLRLEWRALRQALEAQTDAERRLAARNALLFRAERYRIFPLAAQQEEALERNEGLAEYTGVKAGHAAAADQRKVALHDLLTLQAAPTYVRSFAYATGPSYGLLLDQYSPEWRLQLSHGVGLAKLLQQALGISIPADLQQVVRQASAQYGGIALRNEESERDAKRQQLIAQYRAQFVDGPVLTLQLLNMSVQFNPENLQPLGDAGTVYPTLRITDSWGILEVSQGALLRSDWSAVVVGPPVSSSGSRISGDGWTLELMPGWKLVPGSRRGDFALQSGS